MELVSFAAAVAVVLATPGPTNTLLAASGARAGLRASLPLVPAELAGYGLAIALWGFALEPAAAAVPWLRTAVRLGCVAYLLVVAWSLWNRPAGPVRAVPLHPGRVFLATLLNPKALLFAVAVFPATAFRDAGGFLPPATLFAAILVPVAVAWIALGAALAGPSGRSRARIVERVAAVVLGGFSASLAASALG